MFLALTTVRCGLRILYGLGYPCQSESSFSKFISHTVGLRSGDTGGSSRYAIPFSLHLLNGSCSMCSFINVKLGEVVHGTQKHGMLVMLSLHVK